MKGIIIYIKLPAYLRQWLITNLGLPVRFPSRSFESILLSRLCKRRPQTVPIETTCPAGCVPVVLPDNSLHRPEFYNYLGPKDEHEMTRALENLFRLHLWVECSYLCTRQGLLNSGLNDWCRAQGIDEVYREAVRQKFYRMRNLYNGTGIKLGKKYFNKTTAIKHTKNEQH